MLSFRITSCFMCFNSILKNFCLSVTMLRVTMHFKQLLKGAVKKVKSGMKFQTFKIFNLETNRFTEMLKQPRKRRYDVVHNVEPLLILKSTGEARHFHLGGPLEGPVLQQGELSMVCVGLSERDLKNFGEPLGGQAKFWGAVPPLKPP